MRSPTAETLTGTASISSPSSSRDDAHVAGVLGHGAFERVVLADELRDEAVLRLLRKARRARRAAGCGHRQKTATRSDMVSASVWSVGDVDDRDAQPVRKVGDLELQGFAQLLVERAERFRPSAPAPASNTRARASAMRCCWPPDSCAGRRPPKSGTSAPCRGRASPFPRARTCPCAAPQAGRTGFRPPSCAGTARSSGTPSRCRACLRRKCC